jgi:hypothetical protein
VRIQSQERFYGKRRVWCDFETNRLVQLDTRASGYLISSRVCGAVAQFGRAPRSQCGGQGFDPPLLHQARLLQPFRGSNSGLTPSCIRLLNHPQLTRRISSRHFVVDVVAARVTRPAGVRITVSSLDGTQEKLCMGT